MAQQIAEYNGPQTGATPDSAGAEAYFRSGRVIQNESRVAGQDISNIGQSLGGAIDRHQTQEDVLGFGAAANAATLKLHQDIDNLKDPSDPAQVATVTDNYNNTIQDLQSQFGRTDASRLHVGEVGQGQMMHGYEYAHGVMTQAAGVKAVNSYMEQANTGAAIVEKDASALPQQMQQLNQTYDTIGAGLTAEGRTELAKHKEIALDHLVTSWGRGLINNNPDAAEKIMNAAPDDIMAHFPNFGAEIKQAQNTKKSLDALNNANARAAAHDDFARRENDLNWRITHATPDQMQSFGPEIQALGQHRGASEGFTERADQLINARTYQLENGKATPTNQATVASLDQKVKDGSLTPGDVGQAYGLHQLSQGSFDFYSKVANTMSGGSDVAGSTGAIVQTINQYARQAGDQFRAMNNLGLAAQEEAQTQAQLRQRWVDGHDAGASNQEMLTDQKSKWFLGNVLQEHIYTQKDLIQRNVQFMTGQAINAPGTPGAPTVVPVVPSGFTYDPKLSYEENKAKADQMKGAAAIAKPKQNEDQEIPALPPGPGSL